MGQGNAIMKQVLLAFLLLIVVVIGGMVATSAAVRKTNIVLGAQSDQDLSLLAKNIKWDPDGHISYVTFSTGARRFFISGNQKTYTIDTTTPLSLKDALSKNLATIKENYGPDVNVSYKNHYATIDSVVQTDPKNLNRLFAFTQNEEQLKKADGSFDYSNFTASVGLLESTDGGNTWKDYGPVIKGDDYLTPGTKVTGAGEPAAIINNGYVYIYFVDWAAGIKTNHADQIYLARSKVFPDGGLGALEYLKTGGGFSKGMANLQPVIKPAGGTGYTSLPSISYNKYLNSYLAIYQTDLGFYQAVSADGINWNNDKVIINFVKPLSARESGDVWIGYPTFLSDQSENSDGSTTNTGNLYFGKGIWPDTAHQLTVKPFEIK